MQTASGLSWAFTTQLNSRFAHCLNEIEGERRERGERGNMWERVHRHGLVSELESCATVSTVLSRQRRSDKPFNLSSNEQNARKTLTGTGQSLLHTHKHSSHLQALLLKKTLHSCAIFVGCVPAANKNCFAVMICNVKLIILCRWALWFILHNGQFIR